ncbi:MAG: prepilin-type N-terminal cleavage/methylation domain-containing protein [candidate division Zixibacteria bacterium]|nr:prepilin-type N-terminal cleavage/methylation domain-containing protein [candidate division Zixibacteria bacterium]MCI0595636.1 prepilin-type N-terminal cleavage/methylation domain-containing protein [candidate division Zixibacteria bacterium]
MTIRKNDKGFTLIEVMISMVILAIGILGLAPLMVLSIYSNTYSQDLTRATAVAQDRIEQLKPQPNSFFGVMPYEEPPTSIDGTYNRTVRVDDTSTDGTVPVGVYRIKVTIAWTDEKGMARSVDYYTYKTIQ